MIIVIIVIIMIIVTIKIINMIIKKHIGILAMINHSMKVEILIHNHPHQSYQSLPSIHLYLQDIQFHRVQNLPDLE